MSGRASQLEAYLLRLCGAHPHLLPVIDAFVSPYCTLIVSPLATGGSLFHWMRSRQEVSMLDTYQVMHQWASGMATPLVVRCHGGVAP